jgi:hypothetical protein
MFNDDVLLDADGNKHENLGVEFLTNLYGWSIWKETFKDGSQRKNYAQIGGTYDEDKDAFIPVKSLIHLGFLMKLLVNTNHQ